MMKMKHQQTIHHSNIKKNKTKKNPIQFDTKF